MRTACHYPGDLEELVVDLRYSHQVAFLHAEKAAEPWARYAGRRVRSP